MSDQFKNINCFIFDIDGVLTDGMVLVLENGLQARQMNVKDGFALQLAVKKGYRMLVVSGAVVSPVIDRLNKLGVTDVHMGITDKGAFVEAYLRTNKLKTEEVLFMGDDVPDMPVMRLAGLPTCPNDAVAEIKEIAKFISSAAGGKGCVREVIEKVLRARGDWHTADGVASK